MNSTFRHFTSTIVATALFVAAGFCLTNAFGKQHRVSPNSPDAPATGGEQQRTGIYAVTGFTFSTPQALIHPPTPVTPGVTLKDQDTESEIKVDIFGDVYVTAISGSLSDCKKCGTLGGSSGWPVSSTVGPNVKLPGT